MELALAASLISSFVIITILFLQWNVFVSIQHLRCRTCEKKKHDIDDACPHDHEVVVIPEEMVVQIPLWP